ncbi:MAG: alpha-D-ribose 1-methylphosphonate 5-triphosphate diphosphatase [Coriobacteriia bacterium]|nr:alpha-D-ribose 1-methylphosphonate 5-triphosphate diphosphatase [Coriobacteriia bacterium]
MIAIKNGRIITPESIVQDKVLLIEGERIVGLGESAEGASMVVDAHGRYVMPGIIDMHSDKIEQYIQPRPTSQLDFEFALKTCERDLLGAGITTMYHSLSLYKNDIFGKSLLKTKETVQKLADLIATIHTRYHLIHHRFHLRIEIDNLEAFDIVQAMLEQDVVHLISFMDHTPGQGQYRDLEVYQNAVMKYNGGEVNDAGFESIMQYHKCKDTLSFGQMKQLAALAHKKGIAVASHDDDSLDKLALNKELGVCISEFPISLEVAQGAKEYGFYTVVGSANILRGCSHSGNLSAAEAILNDCGDIICSDYYPAASLQSVFYMNENHGVPLPDMVRRVSLNPAKALGTAKDYGSIEAGKKADILIVELLDGYPVITHAFVDGNRTSRIEYRKSMKNEE